MATSDSTGGSGTIREAVGVFLSHAELQSAVDDLLRSGFDRAEVSLLAAENAVERELGHLYERVAELEDDPKVPRAAYVGKDSVVEAKTGVIGGLAYIGALAAVGAVVASGGTIGGAIAAAAIAAGGGGVVGAVLARLIGRDRARNMEHQLERGGLLLWVRIRDEEHEKRAVEILTRNAADDVHVHEIEGSHDPAANPLSGILPDPFLNARI